MQARENIPPAYKREKTVPVSKRGKTNYQRPSAGKHTASIQAKDMYCQHKTRKKEVEREGRGEREGGGAQVIIDFSYYLCLAYVVKCSGWLYK